MKKWFLKFSGFFYLCAMPMVAMASVESSMSALQSKLLSILPVMGVLGMIFSGFCYLVGSPNARAYMWYAILGTAIGLGAESIVSLIRSIVH